MPAAITQSVKTGLLPEPPRIQIPARESRMTHEANPRDQFPRAMEDARRRGSNMNWCFGKVSGSLNAISIERDKSEQPFNRLFQTEDLSASGGS